MTDDDHVPGTDQRYVPVTRQQLIDVLHDIVSRVSRGDSWEGYVNWLMPDPDDGHPPEIVAVLHARYRIGNSDGSQGGMRVIGDLI